MGLDPRAIPFAASEAAGDLEVWRGEVIVGAYPWHTHVEYGADRIYVIDVPSGRLVREFRNGTWTKVCHTSR